MVGAQDARAVGRHLLFEADGLVRSPGPEVRQGEACPGREAVGVVGSQEPYAVGEDLLLDGQRLLVQSGLVV